MSHLSPSGVIASLPANLVQVPVVKQREHFSCGAAAALAMLRYWRAGVYATVDERALYGPLQTTEARGTEPEAMVALLQRNELEAEYRHGEVRAVDLVRAVDAREPPIVDLQAWRDCETIAWRETWDAGHYVLFVGYDHEYLFFVDPSTMTPNGYVFLPRGELDERWHNLAGDGDDRVERMAIFVRGTTPWIPDQSPPPHATRLE